ncbi:MAG: U32 family peptidase [Candidatus Lernaella stagnicola]|nr:U32 family peptidase [Candidatus Lernaella stagnicola]
MSPLNRIEEVEALIEDGATCFYAGVMPPGWRDRYSNMASPNRREWKSSNFLDYDDFGRAIRLADDRGVPVFMALNALYTEAQYEMIDEIVAHAEDAGVKALIVADLGMFLHLAEGGTKLELHVSTGATIFNRRAAELFIRLGASRVTLPRHNTVDELCSLTRDLAPVPTDVFVLNSGCKNIDGFCTFHHGENEVQVGRLWDMFKNAGADHYLLEAMRKLPEWMTRTASDLSLFGSISACFLPYKVTNVSPREMTDELRHRTEQNVRKSFNFFSAMDHCAACAIPAFKRAGVDALKIVGRNHPTSKKRKDVRFLRALLDLTERFDDDPPREEILELHRAHYGGDCEGLCYYPEAE